MTFFLPMNLSLLLLNPSTSLLFKVVLGLQENKEWKVSSFISLNDITEIKHRVYGKRQTANVNLHHVTKCPLYLSFFIYYNYP